MDKKEEHERTAPYQKKMDYAAHRSDDEDGTRKLILKRKKALVGAAGRIYVYCEDSQRDVIIKELRCRELGSLKSGETGEYEISTGSVYVFVGAGRKYVNDFHSSHEVPRGDKNVELFTAPSLKLNLPVIYTKQDLADIGKTKGW